MSIDSPHRSIHHVIQGILQGRPPTAKEVEAALHPVFRGEAADAEIAGLLVGLATQPVDGSILAAAARVLRLHRVAVHPQVRPVVDTCGTGGDGSGTFNISTAAALVVAAAGAAVAKHGNRGVSSRVGSADVLEALGCCLEIRPEEARDLIDATGFVFLFAPVFHPAMRHVGPVRRTLAVRTIFNLLGPLSNPALAESQLLGVFAPELTEPIAVALRELGSRSALVVHCDGLDEIGLHGETRGHRLSGGQIRPFTIRPEELGLTPAPVSALLGGDAAENGALLRRAIAGEPGPHADVVAANAGAALFVAGMAASIGDGLEQARRLMDSGRAERVLDRYIASTQRLRGVQVP